MTIAYSFTPYTPADLARLLDLLEICYHYDRAGWVFDPDTLRNILLQDDFIPQTKRIWLAWFEEHLVGFLRLSSEKFPDRIIVSCFGTVHPAFRRQGLGTELFNLAKNITREIAPQDVKIIMRIPARKSVEGVYQYCEKLGLCMLRQFSVLKLENHIPMGQAVFPEPIKLRSFDPEKDVEEYQNLFEQVFPHNYLCKQTLECELEIPGFDPKNWLMLVEENSDKLIGFCITTIEQEIEEKIGVIEYLGILPDFQQQGLGKVLLISAVDLLRTKDVSWIKLATEVNNIQALNLYYDIGFNSWKESRLYEMELC